MSNYVMSKLSFVHFLCPIWNTTVGTSWHHITLFAAARKEVCRKFSVQCENIHHVQTTGGCKNDKAVFGESGDIEMC